MKKILLKLTNIEELVFDLKSSPKHQIYNNKELSVLLNVSTRTLQNWRDKQAISYSKIGREIFYTMKDVLDMLDNHKVDRV